VGEVALDLARRARRIAVIEALRRSPHMLLTELFELLERSPHGPYLRALTVGELRTSPRVEGIQNVRRGAYRPQNAEHLILRTLQSHPRQEFASRFFAETLAVERWTAVKILNALIAQGLVERVGMTSATRYRLVVDPPCSRARENGGADE
jgi:hypothetical protein